MSALREVTAALDPALAEHALRDPGPDRFAGVVGDRDRLFTIEAVYEGYLLHYGEPRAFVEIDPDLRLLAGDALYALGLSRVAEQGDVEAIAILADLISASARAHAEGDPDRAEAHWAEAAHRLA
ncbi:MAG TPA: hypothetical protein VEX36_06340 [Thermoleophilaceae bacterium]|nr:hypothetical protein [Thermoleophilaceae bacterium]